MFRKKICYQFHQNFTKIFYKLFKQNNKIKKEEKFYLNINSFKLSNSFCLKHKNNFFDLNYDKNWHKT